MRRPRIHGRLWIDLASLIALDGAAQTCGDSNRCQRLGETGTDDLVAGKYSDAIAALQKALDNGFPPQIGKYNLACAYARDGDKEKALDLLEAVAAGPGLARSNRRRSRSRQPGR